MGKWSRQVAQEFIEWLSLPPGQNWLEVGCGTGALTQAIYLHGEPGSIVACDPSREFVSYARLSLAHHAVSFLVADANHLPRRDDGFDVIVSGLVLNFLPRPSSAVRSMRNRMRPGATLAAYVWDYAEGMQFLRIFWDAAVALHPSATDLDEARRFPLCRPDALVRLFEQEGLDSVEARAFDIATPFADFDAYWSPFLGGTGPAASYVHTLDRGARERLRRRLKRHLAPTADAPIELTARAWGVRAVIPA
jgi:SAM-dependent methyltransferase